MFFKNRPARGDLPIARKIICRNKLYFFACPTILEYIQNVGQKREYRMGIISDILKDEYERLKTLETQYLDKLKDLPKGSLSKRKRSGNTYLYLMYRAGNKVITKYVGRIDSEKSIQLIKQVEKRKQIEEKLRQVKKDLNELKKTIKR